MADGTLTAIVPAADITSAYNPESANYPSISLTTTGGGAITGLTTTNKLTLRIDVYSEKNALQLYTVYDLVRGLLHNQERSVTSANRLFHVIYESKLEHSHEIETDVWRLTAEYEIVYSESGVVITSGASGAIYADASDVTAAAGKKVGDFSGEITLDISYQHQPRSEQERFVKAGYFSGGIVKLRIGEVVFASEAFNLLWNISKNASDTLADDSTASTSYTITQASTPKVLQFLFQATRTDDGKKLEIEADKAVCPKMLIPIGKTKLVYYDCEWLCFGDGSDNTIKISEEN